MNLLLEEKEIFILKQNPLIFTHYHKLYNNIVIIIPIIKSTEKSNYFKESLIWNSLLLTKDSTYWPKNHWNIASIIAIIDIYIDINIWLLVILLIIALYSW